VSDADETDLDLDLDDQDPDGSDGDDADALPSDPPGDAAKNESKRINDLTSKWQKAEARAKKAEEALKAKGGGADAGQGTELPEEVRRWMDSAKDAAKERWFNSDKRFADYGLEVGLIDGADPSEMQAKAKTLSGLIDAIESKAREAVMREHGITPEFSGGQPTQKHDFASMSDEEFAKFLERRGR
jgi:hypothetical protein